jgi:hypothetical protein
MLSLLSDCGKTTLVVRPFQPEKHAVRNHPRRPTV